MIVAMSHRFRRRSMSLGRPLLLGVSRSGQEGEVWQIYGMRCIRESMYTGSLVICAMHHVGAPRSYNVFVEIGQVPLELALDSG